VTTVSQKSRNEHFFLASLIVAFFAYSVFSDQRAIATVPSASHAACGHANTIAASGVNDFSNVGKRTINGFLEYSCEQMLS